MIKIYLLLMLISMPNMPSVKYQAALYPNEGECEMQKQFFLDAYMNQTDDYKNNVLVDAHCIPFESFPIKGLPSPSNTGLGI